MTHTHIGLFGSLGFPLPKALAFSKAEWLNTKAVNCKTQMILSVYMVQCRLGRGNEGICKDNIGVMLGVGP